MSGNTAKTVAAGSDAVVIDLTGDPASAHSSPGITNAPLSVPKCLPSVDTSNDAIAVASAAVSVSAVNYSAPTPNTPSSREPDELVLQDNAASNSIIASVFPAGEASSANNLPEARVKKQASIIQDTSSCLCSF